MIDEDINPIAQKQLEYAFLAAVLYAQENLDLLRSSVPGIDVFTVDFSKEAAAHMVGLAEQGMDVDCGSLMASMTDGGHSFSPSEFAEMISAADSPLHARTHFRILENRWRIRDVAAKAQRLQEIVRGKSWEEARSSVSEIASSMIENGTKVQKLSQVGVVEKAIAERERIASGGPPISGVTIETGIGVVDRFCRPLSVATGDFHNLLFAISSSGKSSIMSQIVSHNAIRGLRIAVFLGETNSEGLYDKMAAQLSRASIDPMDFSREPIDRQKRFIEALRGLHKYAGKNLWVYDDDFYIEDVIARAKRISKEIGGLDLVVADHLHCLKSRRSFKDERLRYNYMSGEIKPLGLELGCPTLFLAQPSRGLKTESRPPRKADLKETGSLEDDADRIWALWIPPKDKDGLDQDDYTDVPEVQFHQLKFRNGKAGMVRLRFEKRYTRFYDPSDDVQRNR